MGYYAGDFYAGARGDPGFFGFLGGLAKSAVGAIPVVGPAASRVMERLGGGAGAAVAGRAGAIMAPVKGAIIRHPVLTAAGAAGVGAAVLGAGAEALLSRGGACPRGFHPCKSKHGCKRGGCVRNRRMNVCNPRALRRSIRRTQGFAKLAMRTIHIIHPKKKGRFGGFPKRKKR